jgi:hypothetical protein
MKNLRIAHPAVRWGPRVLSLQALRVRLFSLTFQISK